MLSTEEKNIFKNLSKQKRDEIKTYLEFLEISSDEEEDSFLLFSCIEEEVYKILKTKSTIPFYVLKKKNPKLFDKLKFVSEFLNKYLETILQRKYSVIEHLNFYKIYAKLLTKKINNETELELNIFTVINYYGSFPALLDLNFPGYIKNGKGDWIVS